MKKLVTVVMAVLMMMNVVFAEVASPVIPVMKPVEIRNDKGETLDTTNLVVEVVVKEETKKTTVTAIETVEKKATEISKMVSAITGIIPALPAIPSLPSVPSATEAPVASVNPDVSAEPVVEATAIPMTPEAREEVKKQVEEAYVQVFGEEAVEELKTVMSEALPETEIAVGDMVIDEIAPLKIDGYEKDMGEIHVAIETVAEYKETDVLVAMIGVVPEEDVVEENDPEAELLIEWIPLNAAVEEGNVVVVFTEDAMQQIDGKENIIVLMRANEYEEMLDEQAEEIITEEETEN